MDFLKAEQLTSSKWRVLAIPFGGPFKGKDTDGEFFSERTDPHGPYKGMSEYPVVFHHGEDAYLDDEVLGVEDELVKGRDGWWANIWLDRSNRYWARVNQLLMRGKMYGSSGTVPQFMKKDRKTGEILVWPHIEQTLTPTPANFYSILVPTKAATHFESAGLDTPDLRGDLSTVGEPAGDLITDGEAEAMARLSSSLERLDDIVRLLAERKR